MLIRLVGFGTLLFLVGCSSTSKVADVAMGDVSACTKCIEKVAAGTPIRFLASLEGDYQTAYETDRELAGSQVSQLEAAGTPDPENTQKYLSYLSVLDASGRDVEFESKVKNYLFKHPTEKRVVFLLAVHHLRRKHTELARYFLQQLERDATFIWRSLVMNNLGMMALDEGNRPLAIEYFEKASKASPAAAAPNANLGALHLEAKNFEGAEVKFRRALEIDKDFEDAALGLGVALEGLGKFDDANKLYASFSSDHPNSLSLVYNHAILLGNRLGKKQEAGQLMLRYVQRGGRETAKAHEIIQSWR